MSMNGWKAEGVRAVVVFGVLAASGVMAGVASAQQPASKFARENAPVIALTHATLIDGTGTVPAADQTVVIDHGKIAAVGPAARVTPPAGAKLIDASGKTVIPGLVGMHEHLFYVAPTDGPLVAVHPFFSFPPLYLASGVTTARTTGSMDPYGDLRTKADVDRGEMLGPHLWLTSPYLQGAPSLIVQLHELKDANEAREFLRYWHSVGFTSVKAYVNITPDELRAGIDEAHKLGMTVTGHLCSVGYRDAAEMGIDNLEHGPYGAPDGELDPQHQADGCQTNWFGVLLRIVEGIEPDGPELKQTIQTLVAHHVAITSTLAVFEGGKRPPMTSLAMTRTHELLNPMSWSHAMTARISGLALEADFEKMIKKEMKFEREFVGAGGLLMAGCDPTGDGHTLAGLGDQRNIELLVEAGFSVSEAIQIATMNGAKFLQQADKIGSIAAGKNADLVLLDGDLSKNVTVIERPITVFKDGVGYDSNAIYESLRGQVGLQ